MSMQNQIMGALSSMAIAVPATAAITATAMPAGGHHKPAKAVVADKIAHNGWRRHHQRNEPERIESSPREHLEARHKQQEGGDD